jgi:hypothetical protein
MAPSVLHNNMRGRPFLAYLLSLSLAGIHEETNVLKVAEIILYT